MGFGDDWGFVATLMKVHENGAGWCAIQVIRLGADLVPTKMFLVSLKNVL